MVKFKYNGTQSIFDIGLLLEQKNGADVDCNEIIHPGDIITTTDDRCIRIMTTNPNYELLPHDDKPKKKKSKKSKKINDDNKSYTAKIEPNEIKLEK